jgi:hypothetical protein
MDDEMREKIAKLYAKDQYGALWEEWPAMNAGIHFADSVLSLLDLVIEKARLWEKVEELSKHQGYCGQCEDEKLCLEFPTSACNICKGVVNALTGKEPT